MTAKIIDRLGDWNPQLGRELKGRLKPGGIAIASLMSLLGQILLYIYFYSKIPQSSSLSEYSRYCPGNARSNVCVQVAGGNFEINWPLWWLDIFYWMSIIAIFSLLLIGTYQLINDLCKEEKRGTLNFIRLSPQSSTTILLGKILGVPILLYLAYLLALPLHFSAGVSAGIPLSLLLGFYGVLIASCLFFYSVALLAGLACSRFKGFQPLSGSAIVLLFLLFSIIYRFTTQFNSADWLQLFYPGILLPYLAKASAVDFQEFNSISDKFEYWRFYGFPLWNSTGWVICLMLFNFALGIYWVWQGLNRRFHNPHATIISKGQSYWFSGWMTVFLLGFALQNLEFSNPGDLDFKVKHYLFDNLTFLLGFQLSGFLLLMAALSPHRQTLQDWARYRHQTVKSQRNLWSDLMWGEKSPSILAIALNLLVNGAILLTAILMLPLGWYRIPTFFAWLLSAGIIIIYATIWQSILLMRTPQRGGLAGVTILALVTLPFVGFALLQISPFNCPILWLFSALPGYAIEHISFKTVLNALLGQWLVIGFLVALFTIRIRKAGSSRSFMALGAGNGER